MRVVHTGRSTCHAISGPLSRWVNNLDVAGGFLTVRGSDEVCERERDEVCERESDEVCERESDEACEVERERMRCGE